MKKVPKSAQGGFSLIELLVSLIVISVIMASFAPVINKRLNHSSTSLSTNGITTNCTDRVNANCKLCYKNTCLKCDITCASNQYKDPSACVCINCNSNCLSCTSSACTMCAPGYRTNGSACVQCSAGTIPNGGTCTTCPSGTYSSSAGATTCLLCPAGYYCTGGSNKTGCPSSTTSSAGSKESSDCISCTDGTYFSSSGSCAVCPANYYCTGGNKIACPSGTTSSAGARSASECSNCASGTYKSGTTCVTCPAGSYCKNGNKYACSSGTTSSVGSKESSDCKTCPNGAYLESGTCVTCPAGFYCQNGNKIQCTGSTYSFAGAQSVLDCLVCPEGSRCENGKKYSCRTDINPLCSECTDGKCTKCFSGYVNVDGICVDNCLDFGSECKACDITGCLDKGCRPPNKLYTHTYSTTGASYKFCATDLSKIPDVFTYMSYAITGDSRAIEGLSFLSVGSNCTTDKCCWKDSSNKFYCNYEASKAICEASGWILISPGQADALQKIHYYDLTNIILGSVVAKQNGLCSDVSTSGNAAYGASSTCPPISGGCISNGLYFDCMPNSFFGYEGYRINVSHVNGVGGYLMVDKGYNYKRMGFSVRCVKTW